MKTLSLSRPGVPRLRLRRELVCGGTGSAVVSGFWHGT
jgi:hypothetical protein